MSDSDTQHGFTVKFIKDEPSETDFFGSHGRVAQAVADVIGDDNGINVVGLLGGWGSGKSTVVSQVQKQLKSSRSDIHFFNYDAWLYQNDPPRRSFLEALIHDLVQNRLSDGTEWRARLADLSGRSEETVTESSRKLSLTGKWIFGSLSLVPIGTVILGRSLAPKNVPNASWIQNITDAPEMMWAGVSLTLAPVIIAALFYIFWRPWRKSGFFGIFKREFWKQHRVPYQEQSILRC
jgi:KAP family P-loop domain